MTTKTIKCPEGHIVIPFYMKNTLLTARIKEAFFNLLKFKPIGGSHLKLFVKEGKSYGVYGCFNCDKPYFDYQCKEVESE